MQKGFTPIILLPFILPLIFLGLMFVYGIYWYTGSILREPTSKSVYSSNSVVTPKTPQPTIIPVASPAVTPAETANWKTYTNIKHRFSFKYPPNLEPLFPIDNSSDDIDLVDMSSVKRNTDAPYNGISVTVNPLKDWGYSESQTQSLDFEAYIKLARETFPYGQGCIPKGGQEEIVIIANQKSVLFKGYCEDRNATYLQLPNSQKVISITENEISKGSFDTVFNKILSTFKFIN